MKNIFTAVALFTISVPFSFPALAQAEGKSTLGTATAYSAGYCDVYDQIGSTFCGSAYLSKIPGMTKETIAERVSSGMTRLNKYKNLQENPPKNESDFDKSTRQSYLEGVQNGTKDANELNSYGKLCE